MKRFLLVFPTLAILLAIVLTAQTPPLPPVPQRDFLYECATAATSPTGPKFDVKFQQFPFPSIGTLAIPTDPPIQVSGDIVPPVINAVGVSGTPVTDVLKNGARITLANGVPFTVTASDDTSVMYYRIWIDGFSGPMEGDGIHPFGGTFYTRWNTANIAPGVHSFKMIVWDAALNASAEKNWTMLR